MDSSTLAEAMGNMPGVDYKGLTRVFNEAMIAANITNVNRAAMFCAQLGHESTGLRDMEEWASGADYEWRSDLGNNRAGDGVRFKGRGAIQITGRNNYTEASKWMHARGLVPTPTYFVDNPHMMAQARWGLLAAVWYWTVSRPNINKWADERNLLNVSREINGWVTTPNGMPDRTSRYNRCIAMGNRLLPTKGGPVAEKVLDYPRDQILQDTGWNCGPASVQTAIRAAGGNLISEKDLSRELGTHQGGTDSIHQFPKVLNNRIPGAKYKSVDMPNDPPTSLQRDNLWNNIVQSIDAGHAVVINIQVPASNYPKAVWPSTMSPAYSGGMVYHYILAAGYSDADIRRVWIADSGFPGPNMVTGYWVSLTQLATMIPPKGYAYSQAAPTNEGGLFMSLPKERQEDLARKIDRIHYELTNEFQSIVVDENGKQSTWKGTLVGYILQADKKLEKINEVHLPAISKAIEAIKGLFTKEGK